MKILGNKIFLGGALLLLVVILWSVWARNNWTMFVRWNLLLHGRPFSTLINPAAVKDLPPGFPAGFTGAMLVYAGREHIGYVDKYGGFHPAGAASADLGDAGKATAALYRIEMVSGMLLLTWCSTALLVSIRRRRSAASPRK